MRLPSVSADKDRLDLCPDRPFRAPEHGCGHSDPSTSCRSHIARSSEPFPQHLPCLHIPGRPTSEKMLIPIALFSGRSHPLRASAQLGKSQVQCGWTWVLRSCFFVYPTSRDKGKGRRGKEREVILLGLIIECKTVHSIHEAKEYNNISSYFSYLSINVTHKQQRFLLSVISFYPKW